MPNQFEFNLRARVPEGGSPLAYINMPVPSITENLKLIGSSQFFFDNKSGLLQKPAIGTITINSSNNIYSLSPSGVIVDNKILDPTFLYGFTPAVSAFWVPLVGVWTASATGGRTALNSFSTEDLPASGQENCLLAPWSGNNIDDWISISSLNIPVFTGAEASYPASGIIYQLSCWIATDPVDSAGYRRNGSNAVSIYNTQLMIRVLSTDATGGVTGILEDKVLKMSDADSQQYLNQPIKTYLRWRSQYFTIPAGTVACKILIGGQYIQGIYFDDFRLRSYIYAPASPISLGSRGVVGGSQGLVPSGNLLLNPELSDPTAVDGDFGTFSASGNNLLVDPSFEQGIGWGYYGNVIRQGGNKGRTGAYYAVLGREGAGLELSQTMSVSSSGNIYTIGTWVDFNYKAGYIRFFFKPYDANGNSTLATYSTSYLGNGNQHGYTYYAWTFSPSAFPNVASIKVGIVGGTFYWGDYFYVDDFSLSCSTQQAGVDPIPYWTKGIRTPIANMNCLGYKESGTNFSYKAYYYPNNTTIYHTVFSRRTIYKNNTYALTSDYVARYFNTADILSSSQVSVSQNTKYSLSYTIAWPGAIPNLTLDGDPSIRGAFTEPFDYYAGVPGWNYSGPKYHSNQYGYLQVSVYGVDAGGNITETPYTITYSPQFGNLPTEKYEDKDGFYTPIVSPQFSFTNPNTVKSYVSFSFVGTNTGIRKINLISYGTGTSYSSGSFSTRVYSFSNQIQTTGVYEDVTGAWRPTISDGIFEREYTIPTYEPSGSWLLKAGFTPGQQVTLIYTIPEFNLNTSWDPTQHLEEVKRVPCQVWDDHTLFLGVGGIKYISALYLNNTLIVSGYIPFSYLPIQYPDIIDSVNEDGGTIKFVHGINDKDYYEASICFYYPEYIYKGYFDGAVWRDLDLNPSYGHRYHVGEDSRGKEGFNLLNQVVTLYLIPTAAYPSSGNISGNFVYTSALDLPPDQRPTSFIRHTVGSNISEGTLAEQPSSVIIGKIFVTPPGSINDIYLIDVRSRGGGIPEDWNVDVEFVEETRSKVPCTSSWIKIASIFAGDIVSVYGLGSVSSTGNTTLLPSNSLYLTLSNTRPNSSVVGFLGGYTYTFVASGDTNLYARANSAPTGELYTITRIRRKYVESSIWDRDSYDGIPVTLSGVIAVEIDKNILSGTNGFRKFTAEQIEEIVKKHIPAGTVGIVKYI